MKWTRKIFILSAVIFCGVSQTFAARDYYEVLNSSRTASTDEIKAQYRKLARQYHPDVNKTDGDKFTEISNAWDILSDPEKRKLYDQYGESLRPSANVSSSSTSSSSTYSYRSYTCTTSTCGNQRNYEVHFRVRPEPIPTNYAEVIKFTRQATVEKIMGRLSLAWISFGLFHAAIPLVPPQGSIHFWPNLGFLVATHIMAKGIPGLERRTYGGIPTFGQTDSPGIRDMKKKGRLSGYVRSGIAISCAILAAKIYSGH